MKRLLFLTFTSYLFSNTLTIYNNNLAHINETQKLNIKPGLQTIKFTNLPKSLILDSLYLNFNNNRVKVLTKSFYSNPLDIAKLLKANLNQKVSFFTKDKKQLNGKLISIDPNIINSSGNYYIVPSNNIIYSNNTQDEANYYKTAKLDKVQTTLTVKMTPGKNFEDVRKYVKVIWAKWCELPHG